MGLPGVFLHIGSGYASLVGILHSTIVFLGWHSLPYGDHGTPEPLRITPRVICKNFNQIFNTDYELHHEFHVCFLSADGRLRLCLSFSLSLPPATELALEIQQLLLKALFLFKATKDTLIAQLNHLSLGPLPSWPPPRARDWVSFLNNPPIPPPPLSQQAPSPGSTHPPSPTND